MDEKEVFKVWDDHNKVYVSDADGDLQFPVAKFAQNWINRHDENEVCSVHRFTLRLTFKEVVS